MPKLPPRSRAEAAAWLARLQADEADAADEKRFLDWLNADEANQEAFAQVTGVWDLVGGAIARPDAVPARPVASRRAILAGLSGVIVAGGLGLHYFLLPRIYQTAIGETRRIVLEDGSTVRLDTNSEISVSLRAASRAIALLRGRANFEVASDPKRPFMVTAGERQVIAIGTAFDVEFEANRVAVMLIEGRVAVIPAGRPPAVRDIRMMEQGERITFVGADAAYHDRPDVGKAASWHEGELIFQGDTFASAAAQMSRYSARPIYIDDPDLAKQRISGRYETSVPEKFAHSAAALLDARVIEESDRILILPARAGAAKEI